MVSEKIRGLAINLVAFAPFLVPGNAAAQQVLISSLVRPSADLGAGRRPASLSVALTAGEIVKVMRENGFPVSAIAEMARVERKTIYSWLDGAATVRPQNEERVRSLFSVLKDVTGGDYRYVHRVWKQKGQDGRSLRDDMCAEVLDLAAVRARVEGLRSAMNYYVKLDARRVSSPSLHDGNPVLDDMATVAVSS